MLLSRTSDDPAVRRLEAAALTELALGEAREATAFKLICLGLGVLSEVDHHGTPARKLAARLRTLAHHLEEHPYR